MFRKYSILIWLSALLILIGTYIAVEYSGSDDSTFRAKVLSFEPKLITALHITDHQTGEEVDIRKEGEGWMLYSDDKVYAGEPYAVRNVLSMLNQLNTESIVAAKSSQWAEYKVDDEHAIQVEIFEDDKLIADLFIGKFDFKELPPVAPGRQPQTKITSYVRPAEETKVYAVNGLLRSNFQGGKKPFRNRRVFMCRQHTDIKRITFSGPEENHVLDLSISPWTLNGTAIDSTKTDRYLRRLAHLSSSGFLDEVDVSTMTPSYTLLVEGNSFEAVSLSAIPADTIIGYYIVSSINQGSVFDGSKAGLFEKTFVEADKFLPK